jgi:hypothetical protein
MTREEKITFKGRSSAVSGEEDVQRRRGNPR